MKRWLIFDDWKSLIHALLGVVVRLGRDCGLIGKVCSVIALTAFIAYEILENDDEVLTLGDVVELVIGYVLADIVVT